MTEPTAVSVPNAGLEIPLTDYVKLTLLPLYLFLSLIQVAIRRIKSRGSRELPFRKDYILTVARAAPVPVSFSRCGYDASVAVLSSPRFQLHAATLYQPVFEERVAGYWMCRGAPGHPTAPASSSIVLYYIHGGAYVEGSPARFLATVLRIAELAAERGVTLSCFALRYSYAPEAKWPAQLDQAVAGYRYLTENHKIDAGSIAVLGDSAGGHLALSLLVRIHEMELRRPGRGVFLTSPWVDLSCSPRPSWESNKYKDFLSRCALVRCGKQLYPSQQSYETSPFIDFSRPLAKGTSWKDILPSRVWMSAGGHEVFLDEIIAFKQILGRDGVDADVEVEIGGIHVWQGTGDIFDVGKYLKMEGNLPDSSMRGARNIANAILKGAEGWA
ncbi:hypothetical protein PZA11_001770 [Diplocarpon coronariae]|uniref:Alpha/beta hydrolase fold-3 domain-containing protein n=1 Tax=Diplocarpon coronariae TaxID=2795749 RepID=A0A218ZBK5_9HELO|nr:alpha/beta hydrolase fold protein [Diplocarpon mali]OWP05471.1 hypothetical protein B2J93_7815 [Marssonina coronariae]